MPSNTPVTTQKNRKKDRSVKTAGEPVLAGALYHGSHVVPDCVKCREAVLFKDKFGTYGKSASRSEKRKQKLLDKVWVFAAHHKLSQIKCRSFSAVENGKKHSLLSALTSASYVERELYAFTIRSETGRGSGVKALVEELNLAFECMPDAIKWRQAVAEQIGAIRRRDRPSLEDWNSLDAAEASGEGEDGEALLAAVDCRCENGNAASPRVTDETIGTADMSDDGMATPTATPGGTSTFEEDEWASMEGRTSSLEALQRDLHMDAGVTTSLDDWKIVHCESNITILRGTEDHNVNSIMLSYIIRAPPRLCVKTILNQNHHKIRVESMTLDFKVVESVDAFHDVLQTLWLPTGLERFFMAPRQLRVRRLWRREDDGSYVVIFKACDEEQQQERAPWWDWFAPVSCKLIDTCYTFSPLTSEYNCHGDSGETLVTQVSCYGDMGGWMSRSHPWKRILNILAPFSATSWASFIRPHLQSSIAIRNRAESDRFCMRPFLQSHDDGRETPAHALESSNKDVAEPSLPSIVPPRSSFADASGSKDTIKKTMLADSTLEPEASGDSQDLVPSLQGNGRTSDPQLTPLDVASCDPKYWSCPGANNLKVRGANYLKDKKKIPAGEPVFALAATDLLQVEKPTPHIARFLPSLRQSTSPFTFIMQIMFGNPSLSLTFSWAAPGTIKDEHESPGSQSSGLQLHSPSNSFTEEDAALKERELLHKPFELTLARFLAGGTNDEEANQRRNGTVKLIPRISQGAWFVKQAVGTTPCLLGRKLTATYHRGPRYFEVDVDVSSSSVAANIVGLVQGLTKSLCVDMAIVLEGHSPEELPESLLGTVRCAHLDLHSAKLLNTTTGEITEKGGDKVTKFAGKLTEPPKAICQLAEKCQRTLNTVKSV